MFLYALQFKIMIVPKIITLIIGIKYIKYIIFYNDMNCIKKKNLPV